jgi:hypothetical protein
MREGGKDALKKLGMAREGAWRCSCDHTMLVMAVVMSAMPPPTMPTTTTTTGPCCYYGAKPVADGWRGRLRGS